MVKKNTTVEKREVPEGLEGMLDSALSPEVKEAMMTEYVNKMKERMEKRLHERIENFSKKLEEKGLGDHEVLVRKVAIRKLKEEIKAKRQSIKELRAEVKALRPHRVKKEKVVEPQVANG